LHNTAGQQVYTQQNIYNILDEGGNNDTKDTNTIIMQTAAEETTGSTLGNTHAPNTALSTIPAEVTAAINQLSANQTSIMQQMVGLSFSPLPINCGAGIQLPTHPECVHPTPAYIQCKGIQPGRGVCAWR
jgi:hypothetical protein